MTAIILPVSSRRCLAYLLKCTESAGKHFATREKYRPPQILCELYAGTDEPVLREGAVKYTADNDFVTYEDFLELTEGSEQRHELIDGIVYNMASPSYNHQHAVNELHGTFYNWFKGKPCTPLTSPLDPEA